MNQYEIDLLVNRVPLKDRPAAREFMRMSAEGQRMHLYLETRKRTGPLAFVSTGLATTILNAGALYSWLVLGAPRP